jgi:VWFA-related protein
MRRLPIVFTLLIATGVHAQFDESITVERILLDVRVTDASGNPITDLDIADFEVKIDGKKAEVLSAEWIADVRAWDLDALESDEAFDDTAARRGRLFVVFVQTDFARNSARVRGQLHFQHFAEKMIESLEPEDRVAVFSFDSHLKFRLDFESDTAKIQSAMREAIMVNEPNAPPLVPNPSLGSRLDRNEMRRASDSETGLIIVGNALRPIEGPKTMLLLGWGLGQRSGNMVTMRPKWPIARRVLEAARVSIFALDTTEADYHDLEIPMAAAAESTGGFYAKTHVFPSIAIERLQRTLAGRYELELRRPAGVERGTQRVEVRVKRRGATVLAPGSFGVR